MSSRRHDCGQAAVVTVLFLVVLLGMAAAVLDVGSWYREDRKLQAGGNNDEEMNEEELRDKIKTQRVEAKDDAFVLEQLTQDVARVLADLEAMKKGR